MEVNRIYNEDCLSGIQHIPDNSIDLILTDPPYLISRDTNFSKGGGMSEKYGSISMDFGSWDKGGGIDMNILFSEIHRVLKRGGTVVMFYDIFKIGELNEIAKRIGLKQPRVGFWDKTNTVPINARVNYLSNCREYFVSFCKGKKGVFNSYYDKGVYSYPIVGGKDRFHPTQKPVLLMEDLIQTHSNKGDLVLDLFMGSGTTAIASINTYRNYLGFELDASFCAKAEERIRKTQENNNG